MSCNQTIKHFIQLANMLVVFGLLITLSMAFFLQITQNELPCPLCLLQRAGFIAIAFGLMLNLQNGLRPSHYAVTLFGALFTGFVALRQIAMHIVPGSSGYGEPFLGFHLYTWAFILSMLIVLGVASMLAFDRQFFTEVNTPKWFKMIVQVLFSLLFLLTVGNLVTVLMICGFGACPPNPVV